MNKWDKTLLGICLLLGGILLLYPKKGNTVEVYRNNSLILSVPLSQNQMYEVDGKLGVVQIVVQDNGVMVEKETSPKHYCSKQGFIYHANEMIVCLPNELVIKIVGNSNIDAVVK